MADTTAVILITGFLGSGKTTFLNRIIDNFPEDLKLTILMNEFGEIGIDGMLLEGDDIDIMEISRGSIFCVCVKTDFIKGLYELHSKIKPDLLIIESTGVADPSDLKRDLLLPIFNNHFELTEQFCIIDAPHFLEAFEVFSAVEKQLSTSTVFIINKVDMVRHATLSKIKTVIREHHPDPCFFDTSYADVPLDTFPSLMINKKPVQSDTGEARRGLLSTTELDDFIKSILENPEFEAKPPDQLASVTFTWHGKRLDEVKKMAGNLPADIIRAKGIIRENGLNYLFSSVMGDWTIEGCSKNLGDIQHINTIVFIGTSRAIDTIRKTISGPNWSVGKILQPFGQIHPLQQ